MPKTKTNKSVASRFKVTGTGKLMRRKPGKRHILTKKSSKRKRNLSRDDTVDQSLVPIYKEMMGV